jgi:hypothetical protein
MSLAIETKYTTYANIPRISDGNSQKKKLANDSQSDSHINSIRISSQLTFSYFRDSKSLLNQLQKSNIEVEFKSLLFRIFIRQQQQLLVYIHNKYKHKHLHYSDLYLHGITRKGVVFITSQYNLANLVL